jgi:hypothetical protein
VRDKERKLILHRLLDKGLWPYHGQDIDDTTLKELTLREMEILTEEIEKSFAPAQVSTFAKLLSWTENLIKSLIKESARIKRSQKTWD